MNKKMVLSVLLCLVCCTLVFDPFQLVIGQNQASAVTISQISPSKTGSVGTSVLLQGTISTLNGTFQVFFDQTLVATSVSSGYLVSVYFNVPEMANGTYTLTLRDLSTNSNATDQYQVVTTVSITPAPVQIQERGSVVFNINVTGGVPNAAYYANVSVSIPSPLNTVYYKIVSLGNANNKGTVASQVSYPDSSYQPGGALTDYAGTYTVTVNQTLAQSTFSVGFLDSTSYHRGQTVTIRAAGYQPNQPTNITITNTATGATLGFQLVTSSADGSISTTWTVPNNTPIGTYNVQIIPLQGTEKAIPDSQKFQVSGYLIQVKTLNLAGEAVPQINVKAIDLATNQLASGLSGPDGTATLTLEAGPQTLTAFWNGVNVGQINLTVTQAYNFTLTCSLTNLQIMVQNEIGVPLSSVNLAISYSYMPADTQISQSGSAKGVTDIHGIYVLNSTLPGITYNIEASIYDRVFNLGNMTFKDIAAVPVSHVKIICPDEALTLTVIGYSQTPISGARIELVEKTHNLFYSAVTNDSGSASNIVTFGIYRARIYKDNILINETTVEAFNDSQQQIRCTLYGIDVSVAVQDLFGNPIPNANVTLIGPATERFSALTKGNGTVKFSNVIGGEMQILAFAPGAPDDYEALTLTVNQPTSVQIKLNQFIALGPLLIRSTTLIAILIIVVVLLVLVIVELFRRRSAKK